MKKFLLLSLLALAGWIGYTIYQRVGPPAEPYRAYQRHASAEVQGRNMAAGGYLARFGGPTVDIDRISYDLESLTWTDDRVVTMDVVQTVQWRYHQDGPSRPSFRRSLHHVTMEERNGSWEVAQVTKEELD